MEVERVKDSVVVLGGRLDGLYVADGERGCVATGLVGRGGEIGKRRVGRTVGVDP